MESWSYVYGGKDFLSDDSLSANGGISRTSKNGLMGCELKSPWSYGSTMMCSRQEGVVNQDFADMGSSDMMKTSLPNNSIGHIFVDDESSSKLSTSVVESNCRDSSLIDLKLGRLNDYRDVKNFSSLKANSSSCSAESSVPAKRARGGGFGSPIPYCQVHGCKKDLSSCKDYHKRHKVCEIHSKTAKVIVNGIEQRFCQQCSRFHLLGEFDDGKRSCRKRLAGHNERRRKPHLRVQADRSGRLFQSFNATRFQGNSFSASSFVCQDTSYKMHDSSRIVKVEDGVDLSSRLSNPFTNGLVQPKSLFGSHDSEKQSPSLHGDGFSVITRSKINENNSYLQDMADSEFVSRSIFHNSSIGNEGMRVSDSASNIQSHSHRALSLLSSRILTTLPLITSGSRALHTLTPENPFGVCSQIPSPMNPVEENHLQPILISDGNAPVNNGIDGIIQDSEYTYRKNSLSCEDNPTINLLELSLHMQRVEKQRQSMRMTPEDDAFSDLKITYK